MPSVPPWISPGCKDSAGSRLFTALDIRPVSRWPPIFRDRLTWSSRHNPLDFLWEIERALVAQKYRSASSASPLPMPSSSATTFSTFSGRLGSCCKDGRIHSSVSGVVYDGDGVHGVVANGAA